MCVCVCVFQDMTREGTERGAEQVNENLRTAYGKVWLLYRVSELLTAHWHFLRRLWK